jgi:hypothetical protein
VARREPVGTRRRGNRGWIAVTESISSWSSNGSQSIPPCIRGLRIPVATILGQLAAGRTEAEILEDFPDLEAEDITAALESAAAVQERELPFTR